MGTSTAPGSMLAKSATAHSGRFSLRMATRSPGPTPQARSDRAVPITCWYSSREEMESHCDPCLYSMTRSRSRSTSEKKISLIVRFTASPLTPIHWQSRVEEECDRQQRTDCLQPCAAGSIPSCDVFAEAELGRQRKPHGVTAAVQQIREIVEASHVRRDPQAEVRIDLPGGPASKAVKNGIVGGGQLPAAQQGADKRRDKWVRGRVGFRMQQSEGWADEERRMFKPAVVELRPDLIGRG